MGTRQAVRIVNHTNPELVGKLGEEIRRDPETGKVWVRLAGISKEIRYEDCLPHNLKNFDGKLPQSPKDPTKPTGEKKVEY